MENEQANNQLAAALFLADDLIYKSWDYRCLAPYSHSKPRKWGTYKMAAFRGASSKAILRSYETIPYDKNFNNWIDPTVLKRYTKRRFEAAWKKSYDSGNLVYLDHAKCERNCWKTLSKTKVSVEKSIIHLRTFRIIKTAEKREVPYTAAPIRGN